MKRGLYFATTTVVMVFLIVFGYNVINENQKEEMGTTDFGKHAFGIIEKNIEAENLKFFIEESAKTSKNVALKKLKENAGVYDIEISNCEKLEEYVLIDENCDYYGSDLNFVRYFNDSFDNFLRQYGNYNSEKYEFIYEDNILELNAEEKIPLGISVENRESEFDDDLDHDGILESVRKYADEYDVPENLIKALIMQESSGRIDAFSGSSYGVMQINKGAHPHWFDGSSGCNAELDVDCNIHAGVSLLRDLYNAYRNGQYERRIICRIEPQKTKFLSYENWEAALRLYNGGQCGCATCDDDYVEKVMSKFGNIDISTVGFISVNINVGESIDYDFGNINKAIEKGQSIRDCVIAGGDASICAARESGFDFIFNVEQVESILRFDVEETDSDDVIRFALNI